jgi:hypothetical protein
MDRIAEAGLGCHGGLRVIEPPYLPEHGSDLTDTTIGDGKNCIEVEFMTKSRKLLV